MANYNELNSHNLYEIATELSDLLDELHADRLPTKFEYDLQDEIYDILEAFHTPSWTEEDEERHFGRHGTYEQTWLSR